MLVISFNLLTTIFVGSIRFWWSSLYFGIILFPPLCFGCNFFCQYFDQKCHLLSNEWVINSQWLACRCSFFWYFKPVLMSAITKVSSFLDFLFLQIIIGQNQTCKTSIYFRAIFRTSISQAITTFDISWYGHNWLRDYISNPNSVEEQTR